MACGCENTREIFPECDKTRWEVQCSSYIEDASNYYTKKQVDDLIESATTSGSCCITPEEVDEKIESAKTEIEAEIPSLSGYATEQWVLDKNYITGVDLSDYALKSEIPTVPTSNTAFTNDAGYLTEHQPIKTINNESLIGEGNITISGDCDLSNYYTTAETNSRISQEVSGKANISDVVTMVTVTDGTGALSGTVFVGYVKNGIGNNEAIYTVGNGLIKGVGRELSVDTNIVALKSDLSDYVTKDELPSDIASKQWVNNQNFITNVEFMQYITNLQNQIDAIREQYSGCCADTGTTLTRWVTMTGASDYTCSGTTKMTKEEEEQSTDGGNTWTPTGNYRAGNTILEPNCLDCGYTPEPSNLKYKGGYNNGQSKYVECDGVPSITIYEVQNDVPSTIDNLTGATFYACCEYIANNILGAANNIQRVELKEGVLSTGQGAFQTSSALTTVIIPNSVRYVDSTSFGDCPNLSALTIGSGVTEIGEGAFSGDSSINNDLNLPNVTKINTAAFQGCSSLHSVNIGSGVTRIQGSAFRDCSGLTSITVNADVPPTLGSRAFDGSTCPIYVPSESVNTYKAATNWSNYSSRIQAIPNT